ncbi:hypothetical protein KPL47_06810 [Clostridium estertheticum]|uniref:hypothetical protein n=1 Tax=Clostridium estertheticum TaxID=238834 RepID=UPI001C0E4660|nr:hypothetical protein [Clostridium estertheticum]MBU3176077.1 hypothetical protein [Clostridium estertheticum]
MKVTLLTKWFGDKLVCTCPLCNRCRKDLGCEELDFITDDSFNANECMKHTSYNRVKSRMQQRR